MIDEKIDELITAIHCAECFDDITEAKRIINENKNNPDFITALKQANKDGIVNTILTEIVTVKKNHIVYTFAVFAFGAIEYYAPLQDYELDDIPAFLNFRFKGNHNFILSGKTKRVANSFLDNKQFHF